MPLPPNPASKPCQGQRLLLSQLLISSKLQLTRVPSNIASRPWRAMGNRVIRIKPEQSAERSVPDPLLSWRLRITMSGTAKLASRLGIRRTAHSASPNRLIDAPISQCSPGGLLR